MMDKLSCGLHYDLLNLLDIYTEVRFYWHIWATDFDVYRKQVTSAAVHIFSDLVNFSIKYDINKNKKQKELEKDDSLRSVGRSAHRTYCCVVLAIIAFYRFTFVRDSRHAKITLLKGRLDRIMGFKC